MYNVEMESSGNNKYFLIYARGLIIRCILICILSGISGVLFAEKTIAFRFSSDKQDEPLEEILYLSMAVELLDAGFSSFRKAGDTEYTIHLEYKTLSGIAEIRLTLYKTKNPKTVIAEAEFQAPIDFSFDQKVSIVVRRLLVLALIPPEPETVSKIEGFPTLNGVENASETEKKKLYTLGGSMGGVFFFGKMAEYSPFGIVGNLHAGLLIHRGSINISPGLRIGTIRAFNDPGYTGGSLWLSIATAEVRVSTPIGQQFLLAGEVSCGAVVITVVNTDATLNKTAPYADAGIRSCLELPNSFNIGIDARFMVIFTKEVVLMGIIPSLSVGRDF